MTVYVHVVDPLCRCPDILKWYMCFEVVVLESPYDSFDRAIQLKALIELEFTTGFLKNQYDDLPAGRLR